MKLRSWQLATVGFPLPKSASPFLYQHAKPLCLGLLFALSLGHPRGLWGQEQQLKEPQEQYGLKAGLNFAELFGEDAIPASDRKTGYSVGAYGSFPLGPSLYLQTELLWSLQGEKSPQGRYHISYLNIPCLLRWKEGAFYTELGPQFGILTVNTSQKLAPELRLENFETFELAMVAGLGYHLDEDWSIGLRYTQGLTNIAAGQDLKNSVLYLGLSYRLF